MNCINCNSEVSLNYCSNCGQPLKLKRIDKHYIIHEIEHVLHLERGIFYTIKGLITSPGDHIKQFFSENRTRLVKPIIFIIVTSLIYSIANHFFHVEEVSYAKYEKVLQQTTTGKIFTWIQDHYGYANIILGLFIGFWTKIFFRKYGYNFFEILILLCFVMGIGMLISALFALIQGLTKIDLVQAANALGILYTSWAIGNFFDKKKPMSYVKALASNILGLATAVISLNVIGIIIDILKH